MVWKALLGPVLTNDDGFANHGADGRGAVNYTGGVVVGSGTSAALKHRNAFALSAGALQKRALCAWVFRTDKLLQLQSRWRIAVGMFHSKPLQYTTPAPFKKMSSAQCSKELCDFFRKKARSESALMDEMMEQDVMLRDLRNVAMNKQTVLLNKEPEKDQTLDCLKIHFCAGPCTSTLEETTMPSPPQGLSEEEVRVWQNAHPLFGIERRFLKPYSGGRYASLVYHLRSGVKIETRNVRVCGMCNDRFLSLAAEYNMDADARDMMHMDAMAVRRKLLTAGSFMLCPATTETL
tara:strand:- start:274 stop:1149 length:876 start_codon:yes stop_codon:yes gene_type:complete